MEKPKKLWYTRWWMIIIYVLIVLIILASITPKSNNTNQAINQTSNTELIQSSTQENPEPTSVQTIGSVSFYAKNSDADPAVDGLEVRIEPRDKDDQIVQTDGTVSVKLWKSVTINYERKCLQRDEDLLDSWEGIKINKDNVGFIFGVEINLLYQKYKSTSDTNVV